MRKVRARTVGGVCRNTRGYVPINPVELHQVIRARLLKLRMKIFPATSEYLLSQCTTT